MAWILRHHRVSTGNSNLELAARSSTLWDDNHVLLARGCHHDHLLTNTHIRRYIHQHELHLRGNLRLRCCSHVWLHWILHAVTSSADRIMQLLLWVL